jgi:hypothetical protein
MKRKIVVLISFVVLAAVAGGLFYFWQSQKDVRALNKTLPKGVFVTKSLWGNEYKVVNKIDNYEFKVSKAWKGVYKIKYVPERTEVGYTASSISLFGRVGEAIFVNIDRFKNDSTNLTLESWAKTNFEAVGLIGSFTNDKVGELDIIKAQEKKHLGGMYVYFFKKDSFVYVITNGSEESIKEIILNGKW